MIQELLGIIGEISQFFQFSFCLQVVAHQSQNVKKSNLHL